MWFAPQKMSEKINKNKNYANNSFAEAQKSLRKRSYKVFQF